MEKVNVLKIETEQAQTSIKQLRKELMEMKNQMANLEEGGDEFVKIANKAGDLKHQIDEINESIKGASSDMGDMIGNATNASAGLVGAFQAVEGALHLMGVESEAVGEALAKMQSLMAITQGLASIDDGIKSFGKLKTAITMATTGMNSFKKALISTGLGAIVVVLGSIIANWEEFSKAIGISDATMEKFGQVASGVLNVILSSVKGLGTAISRLISGDFKGAVESAKQAFNVVENYQAGVTKNIEEKAEEAAKKAEEEAKEVARKAEEARLKRKKAQEEEIELLEISIKRKKILQGEEYKATYEYIQEMLKLYAMKKKMYEDDKVAFEQTENERLEFLKTVPDENLKALQTHIQGVTVSTNVKEKALKDLDDFANKWKAKNKEVQDNATKTSVSAYDSFSNTVAGMNYVASSFTSILGTLSAQQDSNTKEGFEMQKKLNISTATINGLMGILNAWVSAMSPSNAWMTIYGQIAMGAAQSIAMATMMGVQIDAIKKQSFGGSSSIGTSSAPSTNLSALTALNQPQFTQDVNGSSIEHSINQQKNTKVYVLESDITSAQNKVEVARSENVY